MSAAPGPRPRVPVRTAYNFGWSAIAQVWSLLLSMISAMALARLLTPADFGVLAVAAPVMGIAHQLQVLGFSSAIIQAREIDKRQLDTLFWTSLSLSLLLALTIGLTAPLVARLLHDSRLRAVLVVAAVSILAMALTAQPTAILARNLRFRAIALRNIVSTTLGTLAALAVAVATHSYWALIVGMVLVPVVNFAGSASLARWRPGLPRFGANAGAIQKFGLTVWAANLFNVTSRNADNLIVSYATSPRELGIYDRAYRLLLYPINQAVFPLGQVLIPTLSRCIDDPPRYRKLYWRAVAILLQLIQPALAIAIVFPATVIGLLLGPAWLDGAALFGWFGAAGLFQIFSSTTSWLLVSQGRGRDLLRIGLASSVVALASFTLGIFWGIRGVAICYVLGQGLLCLPYSLWEVGRVGPILHRELLARLVPHCAALAATLALILASRLAFGSPRWLMLIAVSASAYLCYGGVLLAVAGPGDLLRGLFFRLVDVVSAKACSRAHFWRRIN